MTPVLMFIAKIVAGAIGVILFYRATEIAWHLLERWMKYLTGRTITWEAMLKEVLQGRGFLVGARWSDARLVYYFQADSTYLAARTAYLLKKSLLVINMPSSERCAADLSEPSIADRVVCRDLRDFED